MPAGPDWAEDIAAVVAGLRSRGGWSSTAFSRSVLAVHRHPAKTASEQARLDKYMPGWRTCTDEGTLAELRVGVGALPVLARAHAAGYDIAADSTASPLLTALSRHADELAGHHRAALAALVPLQDRRTRPPGRREPSLGDRLVAAAASQRRASTASTHRSQTSAPRGTRHGYRPNRKLEPPAPSGTHPLAGQWVRAAGELITVDVFVVNVSEEAASVKVWAPTTGRTRMMALADWSLTVINDPRA